MAGAMGLAGNLLHDLYEVFGRGMSLAHAVPVAPSVGADGTPTTCGFASPLPGRTGGTFNW
jgi:hypothetical protein